MKKEEMEIIQLSITTHTLFIIAVVVANDAIWLSGIAIVASLFFAYCARVLADDIYGKSN